MTLRTALSACLSAAVVALSAPDLDAYEGEAGRRTNFIRLVGKLGSPNLAGPELEGILPLPGDWLGIWTGFSYLPIGGSTSTTDGEVTSSSQGGLSHFGVGANLYPFGGGSGLFLSLGYDRVSDWEDVSRAEDGEKDYTNTIQLASTQLGYKFVGRIFTFSFFGGYGVNFGYEAPDVGVDQDYLFKPGNWVLAGGSFGLSFPFGPR